MLPAEAAPLIPTCPSVEPDSLNVPFTSSFEPGLAVPIPTFPSCNIVKTSVSYTHLRAHET